MDLFPRPYVKIGERRAFRTREREFNQFGFKWLEDGHIVEDMKLKKYLNSLVDFELDKMVIERFKDRNEYYIRDI